MIKLIEKKNKKWSAYKRGKLLKLGIRYKLNKEVIKGRGKSIVNISIHKIRLV